MEPLFKQLKKRFLRGLGSFAVLVFIALLFPLVSCQNPSKSSALGAKQQIRDKLSLCISCDVSSLDPRFGVDSTSSQVIKMLFEGLMYVDSSGVVVPAIAESYEVSSDQKTYTFHLKNCQWSNGMDITAYDFEYSWKSIIGLSENHRSMSAHNFYIIKNVAKYGESLCGLHEIGISALDAKTLRVDLENPVSYFLEALTNTWFFPVCKFIDQTTGNWAAESKKAFVCSGPFHLQEHLHNNEVLLEKNPLFWDASRVCLKKISITIVKDPMTQLCLFEKGEIDWLGKPLSGLPLDACAILKKEKKVSLHPSLGVYWYFFNTDRFPFTNKKIRQAFSYAVNRKEITEYILQANELPATSLLPSVYGLNEEQCLFDNNKEKARELLSLGLEELGIKRRNLPEITISYNSDEIHQNVAQIVQQQIFAVLGVRVKLRHAEWKVHYNNLRQGDFSIGGMVWHSLIRDPIYILQAFRLKDHGINISRWQNIEYQELLTASDQEKDPLLRKNLLRKAHSLLMEEMPVIPVYFTSIAYGKSDKLQNATILESSMLDFRHAYFSEDISSIETRCLAHGTETNRNDL
ncbi:MAG: peptide ABC transporter substrate-binding protein [Chlamydiae bacterium]|nr:peptide ABC transporter substrate-binding protein [Chlamydiota bacterium]